MRYTSYDFLHVLLVAAVFDPELQNCFTIKKNRNLSPVCDATVGNATAEEKQKTEWQRWV